MSQTTLLSKVIVGYKLCIWYNILFGKWPSPKCHKDKTGIIESDWTFVKLHKWVAVLLEGAGKAKQGEDEWTFNP